MPKQPYVGAYPENPNLKPELTLVTKNQHGKVPKGVKVTAKLRGKNIRVFPPKPYRPFYTKANRESQNQGYISKADYQKL
jgi:hypothetical protein